MKNFEELSKEFIGRFDRTHFPSQPASLYDPASYFLTLGGKRIRPVLCLMGNELFDEISPQCWDAAIALELFHNFTLIHDDIMDKAPLRRGMPTLHARFGDSNALLAGDVTLVVAYDYLNRIQSNHIHRIIQLFNKTAKEVCEGQQLDMDYEKANEVSIGDYLRMIELKTSVLLASSLMIGAVLGGAGGGNQLHIGEFGRNLGLAFQIQDDYLDAFGDPAKVGKQIGGDIVANKKTFLFVRAMELASKEQKEEMDTLVRENPPDKVARMIAIFRSFGVDKEAKSLMAQCLSKADQHLEDIAVLSNRKEPLRQIAGYLMQREY